MSESVFPIFEMRAVELTAESEREGRPIFREVPYVTIIVPGSRDQVVRKVNDSDKERWPVQWAAWEVRREQAVEGTPIEHWPQLTVAQVALCRSLHIRTVESLATLADSAMTKLGPGGRGLVERAAQFLALASGNDTRIEALEARIADLESENEKLRSAKPRRGRPRKPAAGDSGVMAGQQIIGAAVAQE